MATTARLTPRQRRSLTEDGYLLVPCLLGGGGQARITARLAEHVRQTVAAWADDPSLDTHSGVVNTRFDLDDPGLAPCYQHPLVADAAATVLADGWRLQNLELRAPIPGTGEQGLHQDFGERGTGAGWQALSAMWCISEFTADNGPLRVIPGSHLVSEPPIDTEHGYATAMGPHRDEVKIIAPAGSVVLFDSPDLWHSGTFNYTPAARLGLTATFAPGPPWQLGDLMQPDLNLNLGNGLRMRALVTEDAAVLAEATSRESEPSLWGPRPAGPYSLHDGQAALSAWDPAAGSQFSIGIFHSRELLGAVGLMPDHPGSTELAYWIRPEQRGRGIASRAVHAVTLWTHGSLAIRRIWLEIHPGNAPSLRVAQRAGYHFEQRLPAHCRDWACEDAEHDSWHDCLIWAHVSDQAPSAGRGRYH